MLAFTTFAWSIAAWVHAAPHGRDYEGPLATTFEGHDELPTHAEISPSASAPDSTVRAASQTSTATTQPGAGRGRSSATRSLARLVLAGGPLVGPHAFGSEECRTQAARCETHGTFFGLGINVELRAKLWRPIYAHVRGILVGNASPRDPVHRGLGGGGLGVGAYARRGFLRAEYLLVDAFGDDRFARPFGSEEVGRDRWGHHAGLISAGARLPVHERFGLELWGGLMLGPRSSRTIPGEPDERRRLVTFLAGLNAAYDLVPAKGSPTPARQRLDRAKPQR